MNLLVCTQQALGGLTPTMIATLYISEGTRLEEDFSTTALERSIDIPITVQALTISELQQIDSLTQQNDLRVIYAPARIETLNRPLQIGGDRLHFLDADWLVTRKLEEWEHAPWSKLLVTRQVTRQAPVPQTSP